MVKKVIKVTGYVIGIAVLLLLGVQFWLGVQVRQRIEEEVSRQTKGAVRVEIGGVSVRLIGKTIKLNDIHVVADSTLARHNTPFDTLDAFVEEFVVQGIHIVNGDSGRKIRVRKFKVKSSGMSMMGKMAGKTNDRVMQEKIDRLFTRLEIGNINIQAGNIRYDQRQEKDTVRFTSEEMALQMNDFVWNVIPDSTEQPLSCGVAEISVSRFQQLFAEKSLLLDVNRFHADSGEGIVSVENIRLLPRYSKEEFALKTRKHTDWTEVETGKIVCVRFGLEDLIAGRLLKIDSIHVQYANISSFKNRKIEQKQQVKRLFYESVQQFPLSVDIRKINLNQVHVVYEELAKHGNTPGRITFDSLNGEFEQLTNVARENQPYYSLAVRGQLMDQGELQVTFRLPVQQSDEHFRVEGRLGKMDMLALNPVIKPLLKAEIKSGTINGMKFNISGNAKEAAVGMLFLYDDLVVLVLKEKDNRLKEASFLSNLINGALIRKDNPYKDKTRASTTKMERDIYRSQFNYLWKSILSGVEKTVVE